MILKAFLRHILPEKVLAYKRRQQGNRNKSQMKALAVLSEKDISDIFINELGLKQGDTLFIHSSIDRLGLDFPFYRILNLLLNIVGNQGTILFPTYPPMSAYKFLKSGESFNVRKSPSYAGILTEFARRQKNAQRSLHPTKSVCAIGRYAHELTNTHALSPYPYDSCSPYHKIMDYDGKIIGIGISTSVLSFVHCVEDTLKNEFPVNLYHKKIFKALCIDNKGEEKFVETYAHKTRKMTHNIPEFMKEHIPGNICKDTEIKGRYFFKANAKILYEEMLRLAKKNITIYPRLSYKWNKIGGIGEDI